MPNEGYSEDDYDFGDGLADAPPTFPGVVRAAGVIWICVGVLGLINTVATLALAGANQGAAGPAGGCCPGLVALAFLVCGYQTVTGTATDTRGNGIGSIVLGSLQLLIAAAIGFGGVLVGRGGNGPPPEVVIGISAAVGVMGVTLIAAGVLALSGRSQYLEWRRENAPASRRRRPPRRANEEGD